MTPILALDGVGVRRRGRVILNDISMSCASGTVTSVRGPNGAGKSTLLGIALGLMRCSWGTVHNRSTTASYLPERFTPPSGMDVTTYMRWIAGTRGIPPRARDKAISASLDPLGFAGPWGPMRLLSKGNLQRVGIASALVGSPELIVLDEPFTGVDAAGTNLVARAIDTVRSSGSALLLVHHGETPLPVSQSFWLEAGTLRDAAPSPTRYVIYASTNSRTPALPDTTTVTPVSKGRVAVLTDSSTLERTLHTILDAGWTVHGVERC